jgi:hypothetical protein
MYIETDKEFIYYTHNQIHYKVPTYGRIYKIIDFGGVFTDSRIKCFTATALRSTGRKRAVQLRTVFE